MQKPYSDCRPPSLDQVARDCIDVALIVKPDLFVNLVDFQFEAVGHGNEQCLTQAQRRAQ
jgi:hypothetical protein